jgi:hypothetical protein
MKLASDGRLLSAIEERCDGRDVPMLVGEIRRLAEIAEAARLVHEARRQYERSMEETEARRREVAEAEGEFSRMMSSTYP